MIINLKLKLDLEGCGEPRKGGGQTVGTSAAPAFIIGGISGVCNFAHLVIFLLAAGKHPY